MNTHPLNFLFFAAAFGSPLHPLQFTHPSGPKHVRIIGGQDADIIDYPYQVSLAYNGDQDCGGSIISTNLILTAAHCFLLQDSNITVRVGSSHRNGGRTFEVEKVNTHPKFDISSSLEYDIAVVELASELTYGEGVQPVQLPDNTTELVDGQNSTVTGWGLTSFGGRGSYRLQVMNVPLITTSTCQSKFYGDLVTSTMICAGGDGKDACTGDSGGPLVIDGVQQGIVSFGTCGQDSLPEVFTKVSEYLDFINQFIK